MTILQAGKNLSGELNKIYHHREAANIAQMVMENITGFTSTERLVHKKSLLTAEQQNRLQHFTQELLQHKPVQYVLNEAWFARMKLYVDENVLIPRPETEELVETVTSDLEKSSHQNFSILDIGTGSGCIAISIKKKITTAKVYALDISEQALNVAKKNAADNNVDINFFHADILNSQSYTGFPLFDVIVSNPPYIQQSEATAMHSNVLKYEPHQALFVPDNNALLFYGAIAGFGLEYLKIKGKLFFEINELIGAKVAALLRKNGFGEVRIKKDLQGKERIVSAIIK